MKKTGYGIIFLLLLLFVFDSCAKRGNPDGGPRDEEPPKFLRASPENYSINFKEKEIRIFFDEYVKLNEAQRQIIISPPMDPTPEITPLGTASKSVRIKINDTLLPNTTYAFNFGRSIVDNNEGNPLHFFKYVFSTGSYIDSLSVSGAVTDAYLKEPEPFISVLLYEIDSTYNDSVLYNDLPRYITNTLDSTTTFELSNLKEGTYQLVALQDLNNNYKFDPGTEKIAFLEDFITVPTDSVYRLNLFKEISGFKASLRPQHIAQQHLIFGYEGKADLDSLEISLLSPPQDHTNQITKDRETDTLHYWYEPELERDSLQFIVTTPTSLDTLLVRKRTVEKDSLTFTFEPSGTLGLNQELKIFPGIPITEINESLLNLVDKDTFPVPFSVKEEAFKNELLLDFEKKENQNYSFTALPGAFTDFFGNTNDTLQASFRTQSLSDFGNVIVNLQNVKHYPVIVQLTNEEGEVQAEKQHDSAGTFNFQNLKPGKYLLRIIYDRNENGRWDTGNYLEQQQPEEIIYFPDLLDVRANWDVTQTFILE